MYADVIVDISSGQLDKTYQYRIPESLAAAAVVGAPVVMPFGHGKREGYIVGLSEEPKIELERIKPILAIKEGGEVIESQMIALAYFIRENFGATMNDALRTVLPVKQAVRRVEKKTVVLAAGADVAGDALALARRRKHVAKERLLCELMRVRELPWETVTEKLAVSSATVQALAREGIVKVRAQESYRNPLTGMLGFPAGGGESGMEPVHRAAVPAGETGLNEDQRFIHDRISADLAEGRHRTYLIHGVTGSGKTEVYLSVIGDVVRAGRQVIMLIPEIALTYQTLRRFYHRFGERVSVLHSRMSAGERYDQSLRAKRGEIDIMIGPRSALFTPFQKLGLIILDEEHESSYKSEMPPKYHAREVAVERARLSGASVVLGSATPSLESYARALKGEYTMFTLKRRAVPGARMPAVTVVDLREELSAGNRTIFSRVLQEKIKERIACGQQTMLFLNRRGYAGFVSCRACGHVMKCPHCDISMTEHGDGMLVCHYCGERQKKPALCPVCGSRYIAGFGTGTQKIEEGVKKMFPDARVLRMDADTTKKKEDYGEILSAFSCGEADILVGTQMIVKGHDFPKVTLVGILAADLSLNSADYRAAERTFDLLAQAAGGGGGGELSGDVVIQTYQPGHYAVRAAAEGDYEGFFRKEIAFRKALLYPPASHVLAVLVFSAKEERADAAAALLSGAAAHFLSDNAMTTTMVGPAPASLAKANDRYRRMIYLKESDYSSLVALKNFLEGYILYSEQFKNAGVQFDFDPVNGY